MQDLGRWTQGGNGGAAGSDLPCVKPFVDRDSSYSYVGRDGHGTIAISVGGADSMAQFYGEIVASLIQRAALLYEVRVMKRGDGRL